MTECPLCNSKQILKDYAPPRGYALTLAGMGMLFIASFANPRLLSPAIINEADKIYVFGIALFLYGAYNMFQHGNRFCVACGYKFRVLKSNAALAKSGGKIDQAFNKAENSLAQKKTILNEVACSRLEHEKKGHKTNTNTKMLLPCLKLSDPTQRANAAESLASITGQDFGEDYDAWKNWLDNNRKS